MTPYRICDQVKQDWQASEEDAIAEFARTTSPKKDTMTPAQKKLQAILEVSTEFESASGAFPPFTSAHEGYAILKEEVDELWDEVKKKPSLRSNMALEKEAIQVAAMALRFLVDVCYKGK